MRAPDARDVSTGLSLLGRYDDDLGLGPDLRPRESWDDGDGLAAPGASR